MPVMLRMPIWQVWKSATSKGLSRLAGKSTALLHRRRRQPVGGNGAEDC
jgi:hypothetical protein